MDNSGSLLIAVIVLLVVIFIFYNTRRNGNNKNKKSNVSDNTKYKIVIDETHLDKDSTNKIVVAQKLQSTVGNEYNIVDDKKMASGIKNAYSIVFSTENEIHVRMDKAFIYYKDKDNNNKYKIVKPTKIGVDTYIVEFSEEIEKGKLYKVLFQGLQANNFNDTVYKFGLYTRDSYLVNQVLQPKIYMAFITDLPKSIFDLHILFNF